MQGRVLSPHLAPIVAEPICQPLGKVLANAQQPRPSQRLTHAGGSEVRSLTHKAVGVVHGPATVGRAAAAAAGLGAPATVCYRASVQVTYRSWRSACPTCQLHVRTCNPRQSVNATGGVGCACLLLQGSVWWAWRTHPLLPPHACRYRALRAARAQLQH
jgi:hypothetical protein